MSSDIADRLYAVLSEAFKQIGEKVTPEVVEKLIESIESPRDTLARETSIIIAETLAENNWWRVPDIANILLNVYREVFFDFRQSAVNELWQQAYSLKAVDTLEGPLSTALPDNSELEDRAKTVVKRIDNGTVAYIIQLYVSTELEEPATVLYQRLINELTTLGGNTESLADYRIRKIINSELTWLQNYCRSVVMQDLGLSKKVWWPEHEVKCSVAQTATRLGAVPQTAVYQVQPDGVPVRFPPGCGDCRCRLIADDEELIFAVKQTTTKSLAGMLKDGEHESAMIALEVPKEFSEHLGIETPHVTVSYLGHVDGLEKDKVIAAIQDASRFLQPFDITLTGRVEQFGGEHKVNVATCVVTPSLLLLKQAIKTALARHEAAYDDATWSEYRPHITLGQATQRKMDDLVTDFGDPFKVTGIKLWWGNEEIFFPFMK